MHTISIKSIGYDLQLPNGKIIKTPVIFNITDELMLEWSMKIRSLGIRDFTITKLDDINTTESEPKVKKSSVPIRPSRLKKKA